MRIITCSAINYVTGKGLVCVSQQNFKTGDHVLLKEVEHIVTGIETRVVMLAPPFVKPDKGYILREVKYEKDDNNDHEQEDNGDNN